MTKDTKDDQDADVERNQEDSSPRKMKETRTKATTTKRDDDAEEEGDDAEEEGEDAEDDATRTTDDDDDGDGRRRRKTTPTTPKRTSRPAGRARQEERARQEGCHGREATGQEEPAPRQPGSYTARQAPSAPCPEEEGPPPAT